MSQHRFFNRNERPAPARHIDAVAQKRHGREI